MRRLKCFKRMAAMVGCLTFISTFALLSYTTSTRRFMHRIHVNPNETPLNHNKTASGNSDTNPKNLKQIKIRPETPSESKQTPPPTIKNIPQPGFGRWNRTIPEKLYLLAKEAFDVIPKTFLPGYKSPCFYTEPEVATSLRCLPYFYLIGMQKCGTTDVWDKITSHPSIIRTFKEPHYWTRYRVVKNVSIHTYLRQQSLKLVKKMKSNESSMKELITCDGSTSVMSDNRWQDMTLDPYEGPEYPAAHIMREIQPMSKHIIVLRDPVERTYSDFRFFGVEDGPFGNGITPEIFHKYVDDDIEQFSKCTTKFSRRACAYKYGQHGTRTLFSYYAVYVRDWLNVFPRDQFYILRTEDWKVNCTVHLKEIFKFLELGDLQEENVTAICKRPKKNSNSGSRQPTMLQETKILLEDFFREKNKELRNILQDDRFLWKPPEE